MIRVLFVCTGNTCRSPIAEAMLRHLVKKENLAIEVKSAGVSASSGVSTSEKSKRALSGKGIEFTGQSQPVTAQLLSHADYILTMTESHKQTLLLNYPECINKLYTLKEFAWMNDDYEQLFMKLDSYIAELQTQIQLGQPLDEEIRQKAIEIEALLPDFDIVDPFGGSQAEYDEAAREIELAVNASIEKFKIIISERD